MAKTMQKYATIITTSVVERALWVRWTAFMGFSSGRRSIRKPKRYCQLVSLNAGCHPRNRLVCSCLPKACVLDNEKCKRQQATRKRSGYYSSTHRQGEHHPEENPRRDMGIRACDGKAAGLQTRHQRRRSPYLFHSHPQRKSNHVSSPWVMAASEQDRTPVALHRRCRIRRSGHPN